MRELLKLFSSPRELPVLFVCEYFDSFATFGMDYILVKFLSETFFLSDLAAGWIYGLYGLSVLIAGLCLGPLIDNIGVKKSLVIGSLISTTCRISLCFTTSTRLLVFLLLCILPIGVALTSNVLKLAIRRYTTEGTRSIAFDTSYTIINSAAFLSAILLTTVRSISPTHGSLYRLYLFIASAGCILEVLLSLCLREIVVLEGTQEVLEFSVNRASPLQIFGDVASSKALWRFVCVASLISIGVGTCLRHFGATFPKTFTRTNGLDSPFELILALNPLVIYTMMPFISLIRLVLKSDIYQSIILGTAISSIAIFIMAMSSTVLAAIISIIIFTVGEMIWAPRFIEWSVMVGTEGREGTVIALTGAPKFVARLAAGSLSGSLLSVMCPATGVCYSKAIWSIIGFLSLLTPVALWYFKAQLSQKDADLGEKFPLDEAMLLNDATEIHEKLEPRIMILTGEQRQLVAAEVVWN